MISARPPGDRVEGGEALVDPDRVVGAQDSDRGAKPDAAGPGGDRAEEDFGRADGEVGTVVLADAEKVYADPVGQLGLGDDVAKDLGLGLGPAVLVRGDVAEGVDTQIDGWHGWHGGITATEGGGSQHSAGPQRLSTTSPESIRMRPPWPPVPPTRVRCPKVEGTPSASYSGPRWSW